MVHVGRAAGPGGTDLIRDWNVSTSLSGDLAATHLTGDNAHVLPTDTQKNTVYALAKKLGGIEPEAFGLELAAHYTGSQEAISRARIAIEEYPWAPLGAGGPLVRAVAVPLIVAFYMHFPQNFQVIFGSSITSTVIVVFVLHLVFNHWNLFRHEREGVVETALEHGAVAPAAEQDPAIQD